jgi:hypothetical protein
MNKNPFHPVWEALIWGAVLALVVCCVAFGIATGLRRIRTALRNKKEFRDGQKASGHKRDDN